MFALQFTRQKKKTLAFQTNKELTVSPGA